MNPTRIIVYVTAAELSSMRQEAAARGVSLSRYAKERLASTTDNQQSHEIAAEKRAATMRKVMTERFDGQAEHLRTVIVMLDQLVRSTLIHLPEIPDAQRERVVAAGEQRHRTWQQEVEALLRQLREQSAAQRRAANGNGAHA